MTRSTIAVGSGEWGSASAHYPVLKRLIVIELLLVPALPVAIVGFLFWGFSGLLVGLGVGVLALLGWALMVRSPLRPLRPRPARAGEADRFTNLLDGLSRDLGRGAPGLLVIDRDEPNAYVARRLGTEVVAVTTGLLATYTRTEQEAVAAHCVVRLRSAPLNYSMLAVATGKWAYAHAPQVGVGDDQAAVSVTRYPPALAAAIEKAGTSIEEAPLAFSSEAGCHAPREQRRAALLDL